MNGISGSVIDCKICNSEEVIPIVAGRWRKHFHCSACGQMVHVREEDIRMPKLAEGLDPVPGSSSPADELLTLGLVEPERENGCRQSTESVSSVQFLKSCSPLSAMAETPMSPDSWLSSEPPLSPNYQSLLLRSPLVASPIQRAEGRSLEDDVLRGFIYRPPPADLQASDEKSTLDNSGDDAVSDLYAAVGPRSPLLLSPDLSLGGNLPNSLPPSPKTMPRSLRAVDSLLRGTSSQNVSPSSPLDAIRHSTSEPHSPTAKAVLSRNASLKYWATTAKEPPVAAAAAAAPLEHADAPHSESQYPPTTTTVVSQHTQHPKTTTTTRTTTAAVSQQEQEELLAFPPLQQKEEEKTRHEQEQQQQQRQEEQGRESHGGSNKPGSTCRGKGDDTAWDDENQDLEGITIPPLPPPSEASIPQSSSSSSPFHGDHPSRSPSRPLAWHSSGPSTTAADDAVELRESADVTGPPLFLSHLHQHHNSHTSNLLDPLSPRLALAGGVIGRSSSSKYTRQTSNGSWASAAEEDSSSSVDATSTSSPHPVPGSAGLFSSSSHFRVNSSSSQPSSPAAAAAGGHGLHHSASSVLRTSGSWRDMRVIKRTTLRSLEHSFGGSSASSSPRSPASTVHGDVPSSATSSRGGLHSHSQQHQQHQQQPPLSASAAGSSSFSAAMATPGSPLSLKPHSRSLPRSQLSSSMSSSPPTRTQQQLSHPELPPLQLPGQECNTTNSSDAAARTVSPHHGGASSPTLAPMGMSPHKRLLLTTTNGGGSSSHGSSPRSPLSLVDPAPLPLSPPESPAHPHPDISSEQEPYAAAAAAAAAASPPPTPSSSSATGSFSPRGDAPAPHLAKRQLGASPLSPRESSPLSTAGGTSQAPPPSVDMDDDDDEDNITEPAQGSSNGSEDSSKQEEEEGGDTTEDFTFAQVYEGPPLDYDIPVAMPLGYLRNSIFVPSTDLAFKVDAGRRSSDSAVPNLRHSMSRDSPGTTPAVGQFDNARRDGAHGHHSMMAMRRAFSAGNGDGLGRHLDRPILEGLFPKARAVLAGYQPHGLQTLEECILMGGAGASSASLVPAPQPEPVAAPMALLREKGRGVCSLCHTTAGVKEKCLVCLARYCHRCLPWAMGHMSEGRKCERCLGQPIHEARRPELGKSRLLLAMGVSTERTARIMKAELECEANQIQAHTIMVNGWGLTEEELSCLLNCPRPPPSLVPGARYWYDRRSGLWGKVGERPECRITAGLRVAGVMPCDCSCGTTGVFLNSREIGVVERNMLEMAGVECRSGTMFHVDADGRFGEEGQRRELKNLWEKSYMRFLSSSVSPPQPIIARVAEEIVGSRRRGAGGGTAAEAAEAEKTSSSSSSSKTGGNKGPGGNSYTILLLGMQGAGCSTIMKQMKLLYSNSFLLGELRAYKALVMQSTYRSLCTLLEARKRYDAEEEEDSAAAAAQEMADVFAADFSDGAMMGMGATEPHPLPSRERHRRRHSVHEFPDRAPSTSSSSMPGGTAAATGGGRGGGGGGGIMPGSKRMLKLHRRSGSEVLVGRRPYALENGNEEREVAAQALLALGENGDGPRECTEELAMAMHTLWRDPGVQATYDRCREEELPQLSPFADTFLDKVLAMPLREYRPSAEDMLRAEGMPTRGFTRVVVRGGQEEEDYAHALTFTPSATATATAAQGDAGNSSSSSGVVEDDAKEGDQRRDADNGGSNSFCVVKVSLESAPAVAESMDSIHALLFCVALSDYDVCARESGVNRLEAARDAFAQALVNWMARKPLSSAAAVPVVLILNKFDRFAAKLQAASPLSSASSSSSCTWMAEEEEQAGNVPTWQQPQQAYSHVVNGFRKVYLENCHEEDPTGQNLFTCQLSALNPQSVELLVEYVKDIVRWRRDGYDVGARFSLRDLSFVPDVLISSD